jgi:hypothetical protein
MRHYTRINGITVGNDGLPAQQRRVPDLELFILARILGTKMDNLFPRGIGGKFKDLYPQYRVKLSRGQIPRPS